MEVIGTTSTDAQVAEELKNACEDIARRVGATDVVDAQSYISGRAATAVVRSPTLPACSPERTRAKAPDFRSAAPASSAAF